MHILTSSHDNSGVEVGLGILIIKACHFTEEETDREGTKTQIS